MENKAYLGDGLYAECDGDTIILSAPRYEGEVHWVALDPDVFDELCRFAIRNGWSDIMRDSLRKEMPPEDPAAKSASPK